MCDFCTYLYMKKAILLLDLWALCVLPYGDPKAVHGE